LRGGLTTAPAGSGSAARAQAHFARNGAIIEKGLSSATHVAEAADGGWKPPRPVAGPAAAAEPIRYESLFKSISMR